MERIGADPQVLLHRQRRERRAPAGHQRDAQLDALVGRHARQVDAVVLDAPELGIDQSGDRRQQGGLAHPVAPDERVHAAVGDAHVHPEQHLDRSVAEVEVLDDQQVAAAGGGRRQHAVLDHGRVPGQRELVGIVRRRLLIVGVLAEVGIDAERLGAHDLAQPALVADVRVDGEQRQHPGDPHERHQDQERRAQVVHVGEHADERRRDRSAHALQHDVGGGTAAAQPGVEHVGAGGVDRRLGRHQAHRRQREGDEHERRAGEDERQHEQRQRQQPGGGGDEDAPGAEAAEREVVGQPSGQQHAGQAAEGEQADRGGRLRDRHVVVAHEERRRPRADAPVEQRRRCPTPPSAGRTSARGTARGRRSGPTSRRTSRRGRASGRAAAGCGPAGRGRVPAGGGRGSPR